MVSVDVKHHVYLLTYFNHSRLQTPSTGLRHPSSNLCHSWLRGDKECPFSGVTSSGDKECPFSGVTSSGDKECPFSSVTSSGEKECPFGGVTSSGDKECPFSGVTSSARVWRKVPESDARSQTPSTGLRHPSFSHCRIYLKSRHRVQKTIS